MRRTILTVIAAGAYYYLGEALKNKGWKDKSVAAYKKALELKPNDPDVLKALAAVTQGL